jgi:DNA-binding NtrC family response regulator
MTQNQNDSIRVLLVDDEEDLTTFLSHRLIRQGFSVTTAGSGAEALAAAEGQLFDVAVVDLKMPGMDGIECMQRIRESQPFIEVIMLTGHGSYESALEAGRLAAHRYLIKPYEFETLLEQIREAHATKAKRMADGFEEELSKLSVAPGISPRDIMRRQAELRRKYEMD